MGEEIGYFLVILVLSILFLIFLFDFLSIPSRNAMENLFYGGFFLVPFNNLVVLRFGLVDARIVGLFWVLPLLSILLISRRILRLEKSALLAVGAFVGVNFLSILVSASPGITVRESIQYAYFGAIFLFTIISVRDERVLFTLSKLAVFAGLLLSAYGLIEYLVQKRLLSGYVFDFIEARIQPVTTDLKNQETLGGFGLVRAESMAWGPVGTAQIALVYTFAAAGLYDYLARKRIQSILRGLSALSIVLSALLIFLTYSRAAYFVLFALALTFSTFFSTRNRHLTFAVLTIGVLILLMNDIFISRISEIGTVSESSNAVHYTLYLAAFNMFSSHPILGVGAGNFASLAGTYTTIFLHPFLLSTDAHNFVVQILAELGLLGFLSISFLMLIIFRGILAIVWTMKGMSSPLLSLCRGLIFGFVAVVLMAMTMNGFETELFWITAGLAVASFRIGSARETTKNN